MEVLAYCAGFQLFLWLRRRGRFPAAALVWEQTLWILVACISGAAVGSKSLAWGESWPSYWAARHDPAVWEGGKTIVGGLLGGWAGVEIAKWILGIRQSTGDAFVYPLILGMAIGRIGCFLTGLSDHTCGLPTLLPWGVDFGDGIPRHPAQIYDIIFLAALAAALLIWQMRARPRNGQLFAAFMTCYLAYRFGVEFLKPRWTPLAGLSMIQIAAITGAVAGAVRIYLLSFHAEKGGPPLPGPMSAHLGSRIHQ